MSLPVLTAQEANQLAKTAQGDFSYLYRRDGEGSTLVPVWFKNGYRDYSKDVTG